jgi:hypothetical protein
MVAAIDQNAGAFDLAFGWEAVAIPAHHPPYVGGPPPVSRAAWRSWVWHSWAWHSWAATALMVAGLLSVAALAAGTAHYILRITQPGSEITAAAQAPAEAIPAKPSMASLAEPAPAVPAATPTAATPTAAPATETAAEPALSLLSIGEAAAPVTARQVLKARTAAKLAARARSKKPPTQQAGRMEAESPPVSELPVPIFAPLEPILPTAKANR